MNNLPHFLMSTASSLKKCCRRRVLTPPCGRHCWIAARWTGAEYRPPFSVRFSSPSWTRAARRNLGAHYTSEENILKLIKPLFLDGLWEEFEKIKHNKNKLFEFHKKLRRLNFLDPACGCGNFLVIAYRELRLLELEILRASRASEQS